MSKQDNSYITCCVKGIYCLSFKMIAKNAKGGVRLNLETLKAHFNWLIINVPLTREILKMVTVGYFSVHTKHVSKDCGRGNVTDDR